MAWAGSRTFSFEFAEKIHDLSGPASTANLAVISSQKKNGSYGLQMDYDTNAYNCMFDTAVIGAPSDDAGWFFQMWIKLGSAASNITNPLAILSHNKGAGAADEILIINSSGTKGTVTLQDHTGAEVCTTTVALSHTVWTLVSVAWDETLTKAWGIIAFDGVEKASGEHTSQHLLDQAANSGQTLHYGGKRASGNSGIKLYVDDCELQKNASPSGEMPWDVAFPKLRGHGGAEAVPTSNGDEVEWTQSLCGSGDQFGFVDEVPWGTADDCVAGSGDYMATQTTDARHLFHYSAANPVPSGDKIQDGDSDIPKGHVAMRCVYRQVDDTKDRSTFSMKLGGTIVDSGLFTGGEAYRGVGRWGMARPGGGNWAQADFDLTGGVSKLQFGVKAHVDSVSDRIAAIYMPEVFSYDAGDKLAVMTSPPVAAGGHRRHYPVGVKRGVLTGVR